MNRKSEPVITVNSLNVTSKRGAETTPIVSDVSFEVYPGECFAIVGESGSGKSVTLKSLLGFNEGLSVSASEINLRGDSLLGLSEKQWRTIRGARIGYVTQDALVSLSPLRKIGSDVGDAFRIHERTKPSARRVKVVETLSRAGMPDAAQRARQLPGQLSGGLQQRALIAAGTALRPPLVLADEPTTALDATVQKQVFELFQSLRADGVAVILVSHDLAAVSTYADRVAVMEAGRFVEVGTSKEILSSPQHPYTKRLVSAIPGLGTARKRLLNESENEESRAALSQLTSHQRVSDPADHPGVILEARDITKTYRMPANRVFHALNGVSFSLERGKTLGIVGESGSGKSTLLKIAHGLLSPDSGEVTFAGESWSSIPESQRRQRRRKIGAIYQDPLSSFDPYWKVEEILLDALSVRPNLKRSSARAFAGSLLDAVGLSARIAHRYPRTLSGGQRQRVAIARALAHEPEIILCDEPVSALDATVQAQVLDLLKDLQSEFGISLLFVSHDIGVVHHVSDDVLVMKDGLVVERGGRDDVLLNPTANYTRELISAVPLLGG